MNIGLVGIVCHVLYVMCIVSELEHKVKDIYRFVIIYMGITVAANLLMHVIWAPAQPLACNSKYYVIVDRYYNLCTLWLPAATRSSNAH